MALIIRHYKDYLLTGNLKLLSKRGSEVIKVITIAPEIFTDYQLDMLLGQALLFPRDSTMTYEQAQFYFSKGINLVTHLF